MRYSKRNSKREVYSSTILPQETRKTSNRKPNFTPKTIGKRAKKKQKQQQQQQQKNNANRRKQIIKI